jgi:DNA-binding PadR family transcriptional regulator
VKARDVIVALLGAGPRHGYQLKQDFERVTGGSINVGQIYQTLERLGRDGLVERADTDGDDRRILYANTAAGDERAHDVLRSVDRYDSGCRPEVAVKALIALMISVTEARSVVAALRADTLALAQRLRRTRRSPDRDREQRLIDEADLAQVDASLRWLDLCDTELRRK